MGQFIPLSQFTFGQPDPAAPDRRDGGDAARSLSRRTRPGILYADIADHARVVERARGKDNPDLERAAAFLDAHIGVAGGRVAHRDGDALLAAFRDGDQALHCAIALLRANARGNAGLAPGRQVWFRLAIDLGGVASPSDPGEAAPALMRALAMFASAKGICITRLGPRQGAGARRVGPEARRRSDTPLGPPLSALWIDLGADGAAGGVRAPGAIHVAAELT